MTFILIALFVVIGLAVFIFGYDLGYRQGEKDAQFRLNKVQEVSRGCKRKI